jgi:hypothetical protein
MPNQDFFFSSSGLWAACLPDLSLLTMYGGLSFEAATLDFGAEIIVWSDFALFRGDQAIRRDTGMPRPVTMLTTLQATLASIFCVGKVRA